MKQVFIARDIMEAHLFRGLLESHGVAVQVRGEDLQGLLGDVPFPDAYPSLWVLNEDQEAYARSLITKLGSQGSADGERQWRCHQCGEEIEGQFTTCWTCGCERRSATGG